jgi:hypothetical protein
MLHLAACGTLLAQDDLVHASPSYPKKYGDALDDLLNWAAREFDVKIKGCSSCLKEPDISADCVNSACS